MPYYEHDNWGDIQNYIFVKGIITRIDSKFDLADVDVEGYQNGSNIPLFYHCSDDAEERSNGAIEGAAAAFSAGSGDDPTDGDKVIVMCEAATGKPIRIVGFVEGIQPCCVIMGIVGGGLWTDEGKFLDLNESNPESWDSISLDSMTFDGESGEFTGTLNGKTRADYRVLDMPSPNVVIDRIYEGRGESVCRYDPISMTNPIEIDPGGCLQYLSVKGSALNGDASIVWPSYVNDICYTSWWHVSGMVEMWVRPFIEIVNNRNHYCRIFLDVMANGTWDDNNGGHWETTIPFSSHIQTSDLDETHVWSSSIGPWVAYGNLFMNMLYTFSDIVQEDEASFDKFRVLNGAKYWVVGVGIMGILYSRTWSDHATVNFTLDDITLCPSEPTPNPDYPNNTINVGMSPRFYYINGYTSDQFYPWTQGAISYESELPNADNPVDPDFVPGDG